MEAGSEVGGWDLGPAHIPHPKTTVGSGEQGRGEALPVRKGEAPPPPSLHFWAVEGPT